jgi:hypothetical protein
MLGIVGCEVVSQTVNRTSRAGVSGSVRRMGNRDERNAHHGGDLALQGLPSDLAFCVSADAFI